MANLIEYIQGQIYENSTEDITGSIMQQVLTRMVSDEGVINVHTVSGQSPFAVYSNAQAARDAVPAGFKKLGLVITYKLAGGWFVDEYIGTATSGWSTASNWKCLGPISVSQNAQTGKTTITIGSESFDVATQPVSVSQNSQTGKTELKIGSDVALTVDKEPEAESTNLIESGGITKAFAEKDVELALNSNDVKQGYVSAADGVSINSNANRVYSANFIRVIANEPYKIISPNNATSFVLFYNNNKEFIGPQVAYYDDNSFIIPDGVGFIRINFQDTNGLSPQTFTRAFLLKLLPNDLFIQVRTELTDTIPNIDTNLKKLIFGNSARLRYKREWISIANLELSYDMLYGSIAFIIFNSTTKTLYSAYQYNVDDIILGRINISATKRILSIEVPFDYTIDGNSVPNLSIIENNIANLNTDNFGYNHSVYELAEHIKTNRSYFLNEDYANETSYVDTSYLDEKIKNIPLGKHFIFSTDSHIDYYNMGLGQRETEIMAYIKSKLNGGCVVFGGDAIGLQDTAYKGAKVLSVFAQDKFNAFGDEFIWCQGNHDANGTTGENVIDSREVFNRSIKSMQRYGKIVLDQTGRNMCFEQGLSQNDAATLAAWMGLHYYYDDHRQQIRFITIETGDLSNGASLLGTGSDGWLLLIGYITFIADALVGAPDGYDAVIVMHQMAPYSAYDDNGNYGTPSKAIGCLYDLLAAFKNHTSSEVTIDGGVTQERYPILYDFMTRRIGTGKTYDFSKRTSGRTFIISGHFHFDDAWIVQKESGSVWYYGGKEYVATTNILPNATLVIQTDRSCVYDPGPGAGTAKYPNSVTVHEEAERMGTKDEVLFDVVTITPDNKVVCTRIGAGNDRTFDLPTQS